MVMVAAGGWDWSAVGEQSVAAAAGGLLGGLVSFAIAWSLFRAERNARTAERADDLRLALKRRQAEAAGLVSTEFRKQTGDHDANRAGITRPGMVDALTFLVSDGSDESYVVYRWVHLKLALVREAPTIQARYMVGEGVRTLLIDWVRDGPGALRAMQAELDRDDVAHEGAQPFRA